MGDGRAYPWERDGSDWTSPRPGFLGGEYKQGNTDRLPVEAGHGETEQFILTERKLG